MGNLIDINALQRFKQNCDRVYGEEIERLDEELNGLPSFAGLQIASGPLAYENGEYVIKDGWNHGSYNSVYGKNNGSTYFNFIEMGQLFEKADFSTTDGNIENLLDPLNGWRLSTQSEWASIIGTTREGSTVNGRANSHFCLVQLTGVTYAGNSDPNGLLLFPDGATITGKALSTIDDDSDQTTGVTAEELAAFISQGCVFLPASGCYNLSWSDGGYVGYYWSPTEINGDRAYHLYFTNVAVAADVGLNKSSTYCSIRLVKPTEKPLKEKIDEVPFEPGSGTNSSILKNSDNNARGNYSSVEGYSSETGGNAETYKQTVGPDSTAGAYSHAEGNSTIAKGDASHSEGRQTLAGGRFSHSEGNKTVASGNAAHAEGNQTIASGTNSHAEGYRTEASGNSHAEGLATRSRGSGGSHSEGQRSVADGIGSHAEGLSAAAGDMSHSEGYCTVAHGTLSHAECGGMVFSAKITGDAGATHYECVGENEYVWADWLGKGDIGTSILINTIKASYILLSKATPEPLTKITNCTNFTVTDTTISFEIDVESTLSEDSALDSEEVQISATIAYGSYSHSEGQSEAYGGSSHAEGRGNISVGTGSHAEGNISVAKGNYSHAEGDHTVTIGESSHTEGQGPVAFGLASHAEGTSTTSAIERGITVASTDAEIITEWASSSPESDKFTLVKGAAAHAEGNNGLAIGAHSHVEGNGTVAFDNSAHAEGTGSQALGKYSHAEGLETVARESYAHTEGKKSETFEESTHAENYETKAGARGSHTEGYKSETSKSGYTENTLTAKAQPSSAEDGWYNGASHAEGNATIAQGLGAHAEGEKTFANERATHTEGLRTVAKSEYSHAEGNSTTAGTGHDNGTAAHAEGEQTEATAWASHAEGYQSKANAWVAHAEGAKTVAGTADAQPTAYNNDTDGRFAHAEGNGTWAKGSASHAEGRHTQALMKYDHAEGWGATANGIAAHAEGEDTQANAECSHAEGWQTRTSNDCEHAEGQFNKSNTGSTPSDKTIHSIGIGTADNARMNAVEVMLSGDVYIKGIGGYDGTNPTVSNRIQDIVESESVSNGEIDALFDGGGGGGSGSGSGGETEITIKLIGYAENQSSGDGTYQVNGTYDWNDILASIETGSSTNLIVVDEDDVRLYIGSWHVVGEDTIEGSYEDPSGDTIIVYLTSDYTWEATI